MKIKQERVASIIKRNIAEIIQFQLNDPDIGLVTITEVDLANDYSLAKIYVMLSGSKYNIEKSLATLKKAKGFIRSELAQHLQIYKTPDLVFIQDDRLDKANHLVNLIEKANK